MRRPVSKILAAAAVVVLLRCCGGVEVPAQTERATTHVMGGLRAMSPAQHWDAAQPLINTLSAVAALVVAWVSDWLPSSIPGVMP